MANDISGGVWRLDTVPFQYNAPVKIVNINSNESTIGKLVITTISGKPVLDMDLPIVNSGFIGWVPSFLLDTLGSGVVNVTVGAGR